MGVSSISNTIVTLLLAVALVTAFSFASHAKAPSRECGPTPKMIYKMLSRDRMSFMGQGILHNGFPVQLYLRKDGVFYLLVIAPNTKTACIVPGEGWRIPREFGI